jgi:hypothetical protein
VWDKIQSHHLELWSNDLHFQKEGFSTSGNPTAKANPVLTSEQRRSFCVVKEIETLHFVSTFCMKGATKA